MSRFVKHEACPNCGSRDNLGRWDDGSAFCFGCHYKEGRSGNPRDWMPKKEAEELDEEERSYPKMPDDAGHSFGPEAVAWLQQYDVGLVEAIQRGFKWSESKQQLIFDMDQVWQARNFRSTYLSSDGSMKKASKYFTSGPVQDVLPIYKSQRQEEETPLVIVEDCVSAVCVARQFDSMPVLGSHVANIKLNRLARLYSSFIVWLDGDKYKEAQATARSLTMLGRSARAIYTELDPKEYSDSEITEILKC